MHYLPSVEFFFIVFSSISILIPESDFEFKTFQNIDSFTEASLIEQSTGTGTATLQLLIKVANFCQHTVIGTEQSMPG